MTTTMKEIDLKQPTLLPRPRPKATHQNNTSNSIKEDKLYDSSEEIMEREMKSQEDGVDSVVDNTADTNEEEYLDIILLACGIVTFVIVTLGMIGIYAVTSWSLMENSVSCTSQVMIPTASIYAVAPTDGGTYCINRELAQSIQDEVVLEGKNVTIRLEHYTTNNNNDDDETGLFETTLVSNEAKIDETTGGICYNITQTETTKTIHDDDPPRGFLDTNSSIICIQPSDIEHKCSSSNAVRKWGNDIDDGGMDLGGAGVGIGTVFSTIVLID